MTRAELLTGIYLMLEGLHSDLIERFPPSGPVLDPALHLTNLNKVPAARLQHLHGALAALYERS